MLFIEEKKAHGAPLGKGPDGAGKFQGAASRHLQVDEDQVEGGGDQPAERPRRVTDALKVHPPRGELVRHRFA